MEPQAIASGQQVKVAVLGSGTLGTALVRKLLAAPGCMELALVADATPDAAGLQEARERGVRTSAEGIAAVVEDPGIRIVFDATAAAAHRHHARLLEAAGKVTVNLTPADAGLPVVPAVNLHEHLGRQHLSLLTGGAQAAVPVVRAAAQAAPLLYAEVVSTVASVSAGPGMRRDIDAFLAATARGLRQLGRAKHAKAMVILSPADPPVTMRTTVHLVPEEGFDDAKIAESVREAAAETRRRVPGYALKSGPAVGEVATPWGRRAVTFAIEVEGTGGALPRHAGHLCLMAMAAWEVGEQVARRLLGVEEVAACGHQG